HHTKDSGTAHYQVKMRYNKISIMQVDVECCVSKEYTCQSTGNKQGYQADGKHHGRSKADISFPECGQVVKCFYCRWHRNNQRKDHKYLSKERIHTRYEHVVAPNQEGEEGNGKQ